MSIKINVSTFQKAVLDWFESHGRKNLPWQKAITPYRVWVSEIMLQQTQVNTVIPYFNKFIARFPDINSLANSEEDEVLHLWTGLGYYSRARNLLKTAKIIHQKYRDQFPTDLVTLQTLPGIGRSTAAAILALSFNQPAAILDGNVKRVLARVHVLTAWENEEKLWQVAEKYTPKTYPAKYTQAMMDLGAMICTRTQPRCLICPLQKFCQAYKQGKQALYPGKKPKKKLPVRSIQLLILKNHRGHILLEKRPATGIWGGLWSLPECEINTDIKQHCLTKYQCRVSKLKSLTPFRHTFTHFHLDIQPIEATTKIISPEVGATGRSPVLHWYDVNQPTRLGLAAPVKQLIHSAA